MFLAFAVAGASSGIFQMPEGQGEAGIAKDEMPGLSWWRGEGIFKEYQSCFGKKQNKG